MEPILNGEVFIIFPTNLFFFIKVNVLLSLVAADLVFMILVDILIVIVAVFINVICKAYPTANENLRIDGYYDDIP